jgi:tetratricopeptide (TPR) repeat protein
MSVLAQVLDDLAARGAAPRALDGVAALPELAAASARPAAARRSRLPSRRQGAWLATLTILVVTTGALAWLEYQAKSRPLVAQPLGLHDLDQMAAEFNSTVSVVSNARPASGPVAPEQRVAQHARSMAPAAESATSVASVTAATVATAATPAAAAAIIATPEHLLPTVARPQASTPAAEATRAAPALSEAAPVRRSAASLADPQADLARAAELIARGRGREAKPLLLDLLAREPRNAAARGALVALQSESGERAQALVTLLDGVSVDPARFVATAAQLQTELGDARGALNTLQRMPLERRDGAFHALAGGIALAAEAPQQAVEAYQRAVSASAAQPLWLVGLALAHETAGQATDAQAAYVRALQQPQLPADARAFVQQKLGTQAAASSVRSAARAANPAATVAQP